MQPILKIKNLSKKYGKKTILRDINLNIHKKERVAIVGSNGAGKTTLVEIISGKTQKTSGDIEYNFNEPNVRKAIGIQYQNSTWPGGISIKDVLTFNKLLNNNLSDIEDLMDIFEIRSFLKVPLKKLSGGQQQRFNALLSIISNPELLILDELSSGLDMNIQYKLVEYFKHFFDQNNKSLLVISHNSEEIELLANRLIIIQDGVIYLDKQIEDIITEFGSVRNLLLKYFRKGEEFNEQKK